jgi:tetratricopeptide (TPR) repeat protein
MPFLQLSSASIMLAGALFTQAAPTDSQPAALPVLALASVPAPVRHHLQTLYDEALARPRDASAAGRLAMALHAQEQFQSAHAAYQRARHLEPDSFAWTYLGALVQAKLGDLAGAAVSLRHALTLDPAYLAARVTLADALMQTGQLETASAQYLALVSNYPELAIAHYGQGRVAALLGNAADALERYRKSVELAPEFGAAHYALALAYRDAGLEDRAVAHLQAYSRLGTRRPVPPDPLLERVNAFRSTARHLIVEGARLEKENRIDESIVLHLRALEADPGAAQAHVNLISLYGRKGEHDSAQRHYHAALQLQGDHAGAHYNWGVLQAGVPRVDEAADAFRRALTVNPFHPQAHNNLGTLVAGQGKLAEAAGHYQQALANDPDHRLARFNLGRVLVALGRPREAAEHFERLLVPESKDTPRFSYALATAWLAAGETAKARRFGEQALELATRLGQTGLAAQIERDLKRMKQP